MVYPSHVIPGLDPGSPYFCYCRTGGGGLKFINDKGNSTLSKDTKILINSRVGLSGHWGSGVLLGCVCKSYEFGENTCESITNAYELDKSAYEFDTFTYEFKSSSYEFNRKTYEFITNAYEFSAFTYEFKVRAYEFSAKAYEFIPKAYEFSASAYEFMTNSEVFLTNIRKRAINAYADLRNFKENVTFMRFIRIIAEISAYLCKHATFYTLYILLPLVQAACYRTVVCLYPSYRT